MSAERLATTDPNGAQKILEKLLGLFGLPEVTLEFNGDYCNQLYGCCIPKKNLINLNLENGRVPVYVIVHEFGHILEYFYTKDRGLSYDEGEGFATRLQSIYFLSKGDLLNFRCSCGQTLLRLMPDGDLCCVNCNQCYYTELYSSKFVY